MKNDAVLNGYDCSCAAL